MYLEFFTIINQTELIIANFFVENNRISRDNIRSSRDILESCHVNDSMYHLAYKI